MKQSCSIRGITTKHGSTIHLQSRWNISCLSVLSGRVRARETIQVLILFVSQGADLVLLAVSVYLLRQDVSRVSPSAKESSPAIVAQPQRI